MELLDVIMPAVLAAIGAYGQKVLTAAEDGAASATVGLGRRLLERLRRGRPAIGTAVAEVAAEPGDAGRAAGLREQVRAALAGDDPELARDLRALLAGAGVTVTATGDRSVAVAHNDGIISTGDGATNTIHRP
ncbi:hypothetical protein KZZ52_18855 [Dactylosporangium sp. AC04546]|uniref:hypothetical protein n=1 Tax=Dactylosporangium sp. AC04546 TaxID=2862460 RepID=UPI001EDF82A5|nr:hypothetical protein [Dactylosporangium sp. AC04546]WVK87363.1 hypothetical protein KZZ52_18855 [Dactylosporangium sp. AC04546]